MTLLALARLFWWRRPQRSVAAALPLVAFAVLTTMALVVVAGARALLAVAAALGPSNPTANWYLLLTVVALVVLLVPAATLGASVARLAARRRDARLASLRLLGATAGQVAGLTIIEAAGAALLGALMGSVVYLAGAPLLGLLKFGGSPLGPLVNLPLWALGLVVLGTMLLAAGSAAAGLRRVIIEPLGVRTRQIAGSATGRRVIIALIIVGGGVLAMSSLNVLGQFGGSVAVIVGLALALGGGILALNTIGPWVLKVQARRLHRRADDVPNLVASRLILDDPKAYWQQVGPIAITGFISLLGGSGVALFQLADDVVSQQLARDVQTGIILTIVISLIMVATTIAIAQATATLDRARVYVSLDRLGVESDVMARAARIAVMQSVGAVAGLSVVVAAGLLAPLLGVAVLVRPIALGTVLAVFGLGLGLVWGSAALAQTLIPSILAHPERAV